LTVTVPPFIDMAAALARLDEVIVRARDTRNVASIARQCDLPEGHVALLLETYCNEARFGLALVAPSLRPGQRVLEIGTGIGLLAGVLADIGVEITGIEPGAAGFGFMPALAAVVTESLNSQRPFQPSDIGATTLDPSVHGQFDLIYSMNVLEHLLQLDASMAAMTGVLKPGGTMFHMCPNYTVPYEPHFAIPLVPFAPRLTRFVFPQRLRQLPGVWDELNFVTAGRLRRIAKKSGLRVAFEPGVTGAIVRRILTDPLLAARQGPGLRAFAAIVNRSGLLAVIDRVPARLATPMIARFTRRQ
jgi:2-polyprenyl-3-methyl-5-hydroxy-6-metoxy-1,4-benzoquinol methylase